MKKAHKFLNQPGNSKVQESFAEYSFLKDLILEAAKVNTRIAVSRADFDSFGVDLLLELFKGNQRKSIRVQMKARSGKASGYWDIHKSLLKAKDGRVILVKIIKPEVAEEKLDIRYKMFKKSNSRKALRRAPQKANLLKCQVRESEFFDISQDLLRIFD
jgi:hypothetical protein